MCVFCKNNFVVYHDQGHDQGRDQGHDHDQGHDQGHDHNQGGSTTNFSYKTHTYTQGPFFKSATFKCF